MSFVTRNGTETGPIGQGTWYLGEHAETFQQELSALRAGCFQGRPRRLSTLVSPIQHSTFLQ